MFSKNIRTLYLYVVSFLALMAIVFGVVNLVEKVTNYIYPVDYSYGYTTYTDKESYMTVQDDTVKDTSYNTTVERQNVQIRTLREIFTSIAILVIAVPLYWYHWMMVQKERKKEEV